jgi:hypothetical protein
MNRWFSVGADVVGPALAGKLIFRQENIRNLSRPIPG